MRYVRAAAISVAARPGSGQLQAAQEAQTTQIGTLLEQ